MCCTEKEAQTYAEDTSLLFMETSAKTAMNVNELFLAIGECTKKTIMTIFVCFYLNASFFFSSSFSCQTICVFAAKKMPKTDTQNPTHAARHRGVNLQDPDAHSTRACCGGGN